MICTSKQSVIRQATNGSDRIFCRKNPPGMQRCLFLPSTKAQKNPKTIISVSKPLHISSIETLAIVKPLKKSLITCKAYEADRSQPIESNE